MNPAPKHDHQTLIFPKGFLWGSATSAHQVEGNNIHSDWWDWEQKRAEEKRSGQACDQYKRFEEDFELAKSLSHNAHRLSIEWARIEPKEGEFEHCEIEHYIKVLKALKVRDMQVMLTLWHFTLPKWVADKGGWENPKTPLLFERFVNKVVPQLGEFVDFWITLNEPQIYTFMAYLGGDSAGRWPPEKNNKFAAAKVTLNLAGAHKKAYKAVRQFFPTARVGVAQNVQSFEAYHKHSLFENLVVIFSDFFSNHFFTFLTKGYHDFLGINYYFNVRYSHQKGIIPKLLNISPKARDVSDLGWEIFPEGLYDVLTDMAGDLPVYITECGIASTNDDRRNRFLINYLQEVYRAIQTGVKVKGFFYWSLIDNFEWHRGFEPRFGLVEVDYSTQQRIPRPSAKVYAEIIKANGIYHYLLRFLGHTVKAEEVLYPTLKHD